MLNRWKLSGTRISFVHNDKGWKVSDGSFANRFVKEVGHQKDHQDHLFEIRDPTSFDSKLISTCIYATRWEYWWPMSRQAQNLGVPQSASSREQSVESPKFCSTKPNCYRVQRNSRMNRILNLPLIKEELLEFWRCIPKIYLEQIRKKNARRCPTLEALPSSRATSKILTTQ